MEQVTNANGLTFNVRFVQTGDRYGLHDCFTHSGPLPLVEFYDSTPAIVEKFRAAGMGDRGQFVSRYNLDTLCKDSATLEARGLNLEGGVPEWGIDGPALAPLLARCRAMLEQTGRTHGTVCRVHLAQDCHSGCPYRSSTP